MKTLPPRTTHKEVPPGTSHEPTEAEIQKIAYCLWLEKGCPTGQDLENWFEARELILHRAHTPASAPKTTARRNRQPANRPEPSPAPALVHFPPPHDETAAAPTGPDGPSTHLDFRHSTTPFPPSNPPLRKP
jgi:hypothetical protein